MKKLILLGLALPLLMMPIVALAEVPQVGLDAQGIIDLIISITEWFAIIVFALAVIFVLYAAFLFITAGGADEQIKTAKSVLLYGVIGIIVALLAYGVVPLIESFLS